MKVLFVLILFLSMEQTFSQTVFQTAQEQRTDSVAQLVKKYYNTKQTDSLYALTGKAFKEKVPLSALEQGLLTQLAPYGAITLFEFVNSKNGVSRYKTKLLGGLTLQTLIGLDSDGYMQTFAMQPWRDESAPKRTTLYSDNPMVSELDSAVDQAARSYMMDTVTAGLSISVHVNGKDYFYNYGETDKSTRQKPSSETVYEIGSITKTFTGYLLAKAVSEKKVKLTDPITL
ncbi:MAG: serine hydrolase, partial [Chitinophagaceae bacterium]|nr:serine hydrolase [Chitinophagaceae bacterium]